MTTFQSTLPVWGATRVDADGIDAAEFQSTLPVWGATRKRPGPNDSTDISIHAPRVGSDTCVFKADGSIGQFQSTLPVWGATPPTGSLTRRSE